MFEYFLAEHVPAQAPTRQAAESDGVRPEDIF